LFNSEIRGIVSETIIDLEQQKEDVLFLRRGRSVAP
jgi:hypothetical protein